MTKPDSTNRTKAMPAEFRFAEYRLPRGRHNLSRELVAENQRWRLLGAAAEVLAERGFGGVGSGAIATRAGVSKGAFYVYFDNVEECLVAAHGMAADCVWELAADACKGERDRGRRLAAVLDAILGFLASEPPLAHLLGAAAAAGSPVIAASRERLILRLAELLRAGRGEPAADRHLPPTAELRVVAASFALLSDQLAEGGAERLPELTPELAALLSLSPALA
jgi:AcrR family transcriptional regulator